MPSSSRLKTPYLDVSSVTQCGEICTSLDLCTGFGFRASAEICWAYGPEAGGEDREDQLVFTDSFVSYFVAVLPAVPGYAGPITRRRPESAARIGLASVAADVFECATRCTNLADEVCAAFAFREDRAYCFLYGADFSLDALSPKAAVAVYTVEALKAVPGCVRLGAPLK